MHCTIQLRCAEPLKGRDQRSGQHCSGRLAHASLTGLPRLCSLTCWQHKLSSVKYLTHACCCSASLPTCTATSLQYNTLNSLIPVPDSLHNRLLRSAGIGFCAGVVSDAVSNRCGSNR